MSKKHRTKFCFYCNNTISKKDLPLCELTKIGYKCSRCLKIEVKIGKDRMSNFCTNVKHAQLRLL